MVAALTTGLGVPRLAEGIDINAPLASVQDERRCALTNALDPGRGAVKWTTGRVL